ncbi:hypothetical protein [Candidatus Fukatsuia endosymbiont of Tuberolachnus salignus]
MKSIRHAEVSAKLLRDTLSLLAYKETHKEAELALIDAKIK